MWSGREGLRLGLALELRGPQRGRGVVRVGRADGRNGAWLRGVKRGPEPGVVGGGRPADGAVSQNVGTERGREQLRAGLPLKLAGRTGKAPAGGGRNPWEEAVTEDGSLSAVWWQRGTTWAGVGTVQGALLGDSCNFRAA